MKTISLALVLVVGCAPLTLYAGGPHYGGGKHTSSHGGHYSKGSGSSHKGGKYKNGSTSDQYGHHK